VLFLTSVVEMLLITIIFQFVAQCYQQMQHVFGCYRVHHIEYYNINDLLHDFDDIKY